MSASNDKFRVFYEKELSESLSELNLLKKQHHKGVFSIFLIILSCVVVAVLGAIFIKNNLKIVPIVIGVGGIVAVLIVKLRPLNRLRKNFDTDFKQSIIKKIVHFISPDLTYASEASISNQEYDESGIFSKSVDRYTGDDLIDGYIDKTYMRFSEVHSEYYTTNDKGHRKWHTIFKGIFLIADFNKDFQGQTFVFHDSSESILGRFAKFFQKINLSGLELITLENPEFETHFKIYTTDPIEARYLLTPKLMERILAFKVKANGIVNFSFLNSKLYVAISIYRDLLEPSYFKNINNYAVIKEYHDDLALAIGIVSDLDLNTRIWTKE